MRRAWLAPLLLVIGLVLQLTVLNGLVLPGSGAPDVVLVLVAALAVTQGPLAGGLTGFIAGFCLDVAPPGSPVIGQYALVFCLAGWLGGRLGRLGGQSPLRALVSVAVTVTVGEVLAAVAGLLLDRGAVTLAAVRTVLPATVGYDLLLAPFVLFGVAFATAILTSGVAAGALGVLPVQARRPLRHEPKRRVHEPRIGRAAARPGDGWVGGGPHSGQRHGSARPGPRRGARLRPGNGVAGSASGLARHPSRPPAGVPVDLRLGRGRRGDGVVGTGLTAHWQPAAHPGLLAGSRREFRPRNVAPGGSAARGYPLVPAPRPRTAPIRFAGGPSAGRPGSRSAPRVRMGASRSVLSGRPAAASVPRLDFRSHPAPAARRPAAVPRFRRRTSFLRTSATSGLVSGGALSASTFRMTASRKAAPRLRLGRKRVSPGMIGGTGLSPLRRPALGAGKRPQFGYGRRSPLAFLAGRRIGGRWLARQRVGRRSGVWLLGRRTGGLR